LDVAESVDIDYIYVGRGEDQVLEGLSGLLLEGDQSGGGVGLTDVTMCHGSIKIIETTIQRT